MGQCRKLDIPKEYFGRLVGKGKSNLRLIETETNTKLRVTNGTICIYGGQEEQKNAVIKIKGKVVSIPHAHTKYQTQVTVGAARANGRTPYQLNQNNSTTQ